MNPIEFVVLLFFSKFCFAWFEWFEFRETIDGRREEDLTEYQSIY